MISPLDFIPLAEEIGEIKAIGRWVLHTACSQAVLWPETLSIAVNVSPAQFEDDDIVAVIGSVLQETGLFPTRLEIEVTESLLMGNPSATRDALTEVRKMGVGIAIDDFGTGYSSLSLLRDFPFTKLKIDQSFLRRDDDADPTDLIKAIIGVANSLNMTTLAEGVETPTHLRSLIAGRCDQAQGYLLSKPITAKEATAFIKQNDLEGVFEQ